MTVPLNRKPTITDYNGVLDQKLQKSGVYRVKQMELEKKVSNSLAEDEILSTEMETLRAEYNTQPNFPTLSQIRNCIPLHCFERPVSKSVAYVVFDYAVIATFYYNVSYFELAGMGGLFLWYCLTGLFMASVFVIGHDCGHGAFSRHRIVNDIFGHICFAPILAPYYGWQRTHRQHHQYTTHLEKDTSHPWVTESDYNSRNFFVRHFCKLPFSGFFRWDPIYTVLGLPDGSHFWPYSRIFKTKRDQIECVISGIACLSCILAVFHMCNYDAYTFFKYYYVTIHFQGFIIIAVTYMQHDHEEVEVYDKDTWSYVKGQSETIDRVFGFGLDWILHHATDGHVAHHYGNKIPHYHLIEATQHIERFLAKYPGLYKTKPAPFSFLEFCWLNVKLDCLKEKAPGIWKYRCSKDFVKK
ncbi:Omega-6 fatty acid desaturase, endoplasmic reticulum isozyme 1 [Aphelenchoides besseyi]|nr:Omega-6 fatty acid desaturase, endoplasmic reticulum isozyme 1 [Aphelenchoides besseyi]